MEKIKIEENNLEQKKNMEDARELYLKKEEETKKTFQEMIKLPKDSDKYESAKAKWSQLKKDLKDTWENLLPQTQERLTGATKETAGKITPGETAKEEKNEKENEYEKLKNIPSAKSFWTVDPGKMTAEQIYRHLLRAKMSGSPLSVGYWEKQLKLAKEKEAGKTKEETSAKIEKLQAELKQKQRSSANAIEQTKIEEEYRGKIKKVKKESRKGLFSIFKNFFSKLLGK